MAQAVSVALAVVAEVIGAGIGALVGLWWHKKRHGC
jgi:hypothetical protein